MITTEGAENLRVAILNQAIKDYITALKKKDAKKINELERFFKSDWGEYLSSGNSDYIISKCQERAKTRSRKWKTNS